MPDYLKGWLTFYKVRWQNRIVLEQAYVTKERIPAAELQINCEKKKLD
jgi:hypothetical protein